MDLGLDGKVAVVTGGGSGIGKAIALAFAEEGADVVIDDTDLQKAKEVADRISSMGCRSLAIKADITSADEVNHMAKQVLAELGGIDILVNNAGWAYDAEHFAESSLDKNWKQTINLCLIGAMNCSRAVIEHMILKKSGKIVSIISDAGRVGEPGLSSYSAAKGGLVAFSKSLAKEVGRYCINVNCVSPGATSTEGIKARWEKMKKEMGEEAFQKRQQKAKSAYPIARGLGRIAEPKDIADAVIFLCSDRAVFITGQTLSVNGGYCMI